jgi:outer membrane lipoprotein-sorting protein
MVMAVLLATSGCAVRRTTVIPPSQRPAPALNASASELLKEIDDWSGNIHTLQAVVDFQPTAGSVYSGVISQYPHVRGYILLKAPATIRILGQAPVVRTTIFDMVSDGQEFRLFIPSKNKFIIGKTNVEAPSKNSLENIRPQHIMDALLIPAVNAAQDHYFVEQTENQGHSYYVLGLIDPGQGNQMNLRRQYWFDRSDLKLTRLEIYGAQGALLEEVSYSAYGDYQGVSYPAEIHLRRLPEDYSLGITIEKATFNLELAPEKFVLRKPPNAEPVNIDSAKPAEAPDGR